MKTSNLLLLYLLFPFQTDLAFAQVQPIKVNLISDGYKLNAEIYSPTATKPIPTFILMHGYPGGEGDPLGLGKRLSQSGINVFVFNYQGTWSSEGIFSFRSSLRDVYNALKFIKQEKIIKKFKIDTTNIIVGGYSFGGAMALTAAIHNNEIERIISIAGADESVLGRKWKTSPKFRNSLKPMLESTIYPEGGIRGDLDTVIKDWLGDLDYYDQVKHAEKLKRKDILFLGGWNDMSCIVEEIIIPLYRRLSELNAEKIKIKMFDTDHSFRNVRKELADEIFDWIINGTTVSNEQTNKLFIGTWKFISLTGKNLEGDIFHPYSEDLYGRLMYDSNGNMSVFLMRPNRPKFAAGDIYKGTPEEIKFAFENFDAYYGTYKIDKDKGTVIHHIEGSRFPNWEGSDQIRYYKFSNDTLSLSAKIKAQGKDWELKAILVKQ